MGRMACMTIWRDDAGLNIQKSMKRGVKGALLHGKRASFVLRKMPFRQCVGSQRFGGLPLAAVRYSVGIGCVSPVTLFIPNRSLYRNVLISIVILLLLAVLCPSASVFSSVPSRRSPLRLRQNGIKTVWHKYIIRLSSNDRLGLMCSRVAFGFLTFHFFAFHLKIGKSLSLLGFFCAGCRG